MPGFSLTGTVLWTLVSVCLLTAVAQRTCIGQGECTCQYEDDQSIIDLQSIGHSDGTPRFSGVSGSDGSGTYSYNPCYPFDEGTDCSNAAACVTDTVGSTSVIGTPQPVKFTQEDDNLFIGYDAGSGILTITQVQLVCDPHACEPQLSVPGATGPNKYDMTLTTVCACPNGCDDSGPVDCVSASASASIGGGAIFCIILFTVLILYFVGGMAFMKFGRKATGSEIVPNVSFWKALPSLIKDGCLFTLKPIRRTGYERK